ncbi:major capsid protein [Paracoccus phage vB_PmaP_KLEP18-1]|nr:major capsid protein [Paracoccus phage vB_PmaP_KLEP18-1]
MKTEFGPNHPLAVRVWAKDLAREAMTRTWLNRFMGESEDSLVQVKTELRKGAGDQITAGLKMQLLGDGILGDATLEGNEEALQFADDAIRIDQLRHATRTKGRMTEQRVPYNLRRESRDSLADWWARRWDLIGALHMTGYTPANADPGLTGANTILAPSSGRIIRAGGRATDEALTSADVFTLTLLDLAKVQAKKSRLDAGNGNLLMPIRPIRVDGKDYYVAFLHDYQVHDLRQSQWWTEIQLAAMQGGDVRDNPIFSGALGVYNGIVLHEWSRLPNGVNSTTGAAVPNTKRAVLAGAQALSVAFGSENSETRFTWVEEMFDYGNQFGVAAGSIFGMKKNRFTPSDRSTTGQDFGTIVISTYAADPVPA